jgi:hypothetical protein
MEDRPSFEAQGRTGSQGLRANLQGGHTRHEYVITSHEKSSSRDTSQYRGYRKSRTTRGRLAGDPDYL